MVALSTIQIGNACWWDCSRDADTNKSLLPRQSVSQNLTPEEQGFVKTINQKFNLFIKLYKTFCKKRIKNVSHTKTYNKKTK